jgi:hypothetical protein
MEAAMVLLASSYDQSRFLSAADLQRERKFRIKEVTEETVGEKQEKKLVVWFTNHAKGLVLNKTNNRTIRGTFGDNVSGWIGKIIIVFPTHADFRGKLTPALRVSTTSPELSLLPAPRSANGNSCPCLPPPTPLPQSRAAANPRPWW